MNEGTTAASASLGILIGTWEFEASAEGRFLGRGSATFEWIEDDAFVREHAVDQPSPDADPEWVAHSPMPVTSIIGFDDTTLEQSGRFETRVGPSKADGSRRRTAPPGNRTST